ncbi:MAG: helix-turn-helix transcriptional regulator [Desulfitobacteriaceae bacterium]
MTEEKAIYGGWKVREARLQAAIGTQKELAILTGLAPNIISDLERGRRSMSPNWAMRIAEAVGVKSESLLDQEDKKNDSKVKKYKRKH